MFKERKVLLWKLRRDAHKVLMQGKIDESNQFKSIAQAVETPKLRVEGRFWGKLTNIIEASDPEYQRDN